MKQMNDYVLEIFEVLPSNAVNKLKAHTLTAQGPDEAKKSAKIYVQKLGFEVIRSVNFSEPGRIKLYAARRLENKATVPFNEHVAKPMRAPRPRLSSKMGSSDE
jgi:hypothetical protein